MSYSKNYSVQPQYNNRVNSGKYTYRKIGSFLKRVMKYIHCNSIIFIIFKFIFTRILTIILKMYFHSHLTNEISHRNGTNNLKITMKQQKMPNSQSNIEKEQSWTHHISCFQTIWCWY